MPTDIELMPCPWCYTGTGKRGPGCNECEQDGMVPKWVADAVTTDGEVR